jgi:hypothetical protein
MCAIGMPMNSNLMIALVNESIEVAAYNCVEIHNNKINNVDGSLKD